MNRTWKTKLSALALVASSGLQAAVLPEHQTDNAWYSDAQSKLTEKLAVSYTHLTLPTICSV